MTRTAARSVAPAGSAKASAWTAEIIGTPNRKADALRAGLAVAKGNAQAELGPKITAAQDEVKTALEPLNTEMSKVCPAG